MGSSSRSSQDQTWSSCVLVELGMESHSGMRYVVKWKGKVAFISFDCYDQADFRHSP